MTADGYYRHPTIFGDVVVFVSEDDLWSVRTEGGPARRLTANPGAITFPAFSPDGSLLAFTSRDEGHPEAYVMDAEGGPPERLTWMGSTTQVVGWTPDGRVVVATDWGQPFSGLLHLWAVPSDGGPPELIAPGPARSIAFRPDGDGLLIGRGVGRAAAEPARWKRYRGGTAGTIWIDGRGDGRFRHLVRLEGNLANPMWIDRRIYFLSDHEGVGNLYSVTAAGQSLQRHTDHEDFYARFPSTDGSRVVYHSGADLWLFDPESDETGRIEAQTSGSRSHRNRRFVPVQKHVEGFHLHPVGHSISIVARGGAYTMPLWEGAPLRHGQVSRSRYRLAAWLADGKRIVAVTDSPGEESLIVMNADGSGRARLIELEMGRPVSLTPSAAGVDRVAVTNQRHELIVVDLEDGTRRVVHESRWGRITGTAWSPDGRWLAFGAFDSHRTSALWLCDTDTWDTTRITRPDFVDALPSFDPEGRYLYFLSWRMFDPVPDAHYFDRGFPKGAKPYLMTLRAEDPSPFAAGTRSPRAPGAPAQETGEASNDRESPPLEIDLAGISDRVVEIPVPEARYRRVAGAQGRVLFSSAPVMGMLGTTWADQEPKPNLTLEAYDFAQEKVEKIAEGISGYSVSVDGKVLGIRVGQKVRVVPITFKESDDQKKDEPGRESGWLDLDRIRAEVMPGDEWRQMYEEAWRLQRDQFWTEDMSGVDWREIHSRYLPLVDRVGSRSEFSDLLWEMQGELGTSHAYELGGDYRPEPKWHQGFLGADLSWDRESRAWLVRRIPTGDPWDAERSSPLRRPGAGVSEGELIVAVDGQPTSRLVSPDRLLVDKAEREVSLAVRKPGGRRRTVVVKTLRSEERLRYRDRVETNRLLVHERTDGQVGYLHIPDMGAAGFSEFHRYFRPEVDRPGLIVDVRGNRGGNVSQLLLSKLARRRIGYDVPRWGEPDSWPEAAPMGPMVAISDEYAGSDGDIFSHAFKLLGLGPLIGKRTWGGVIGIWPGHALVDGTITTQPEFATWFTDVGWGIENYGTDPDIEVEIRPQDHAAGIDTQLERALSEIERLISRAQPTVPSFQPGPSRRAPRLPKR